jgi:hypothetical protein
MFDGLTYVVGYNEFQQLQKNPIFVNFSHLQKKPQISYTTTYSQLHSQTSIHISIHIHKHHLTFKNI